MRRDDEFVSLYANNIRYENSVFDLRLVFGELDQSDPEGPCVSQHTAITISWIEAKLMVYFLRLNIASYELQNGKINIPASQIPPLFEPPTGELANNEHAQAIYKAFSKIHQELVAEM